jgi:ADP-heptose:LPS heptosyltransferase
MRDTRLPSRLLLLPVMAYRTLSFFRRRTRPPQPRRILIAHHLLLGDTLMLTPLLAKLRARYPEAEVVMTVPEAIAPLYGGRPYGVQAIPYNPRKAKTLLGLLDISGFDLAFVPGDNRYSWLARALDSRWIVAFAGGAAYKNLPVDELIPYADVPAAWGDMVAQLVTGPAPAPYDPTHWPAPAYRPFASPAVPYAVLHVGASSTLKLWQPDKWRQMANSLEQRGVQVVWSAGPREQGIVEAIDPEGRYPSYAGKLDLAQLWHLVKGASMMVSPDTGVAHLGRLTHTPTVALFGPGSHVLCGAGDFWRDSPYRAVTIVDFPCRDQKVLFKREISWMKRCIRSVRECNNNLCMQAITVDMVRDACDLLLSQRKRE